VIDLHCHILPAIDDGPLYIEESIEMARIAYRDGISKIVATPHVKNMLFSQEVILKAVETLNARLSESSIPVQILQGADVSAMMEVSFLKGYTLNNTRYILVEFPHTYLPKNAKDILFRMMLGGYQPIITHPERNLSILASPQLLFELLNTGLLIQITADSLAGNFGVDVQECACHLVKKGVVSFMASDAHSSHQRRPVLSEGLKIAEKIIGREKAFNLVKSNPEQVLKGNPVSV
jgi:protein-tyrosine phosphatase